MKKFLSLMITGAMMISVLTGCMAEIGEININEDGSGTVTAKLGVTKEMIEAFGYEDVDYLTELDDYEIFTYNDVEYYGTIESNTFDRVEELFQDDSTPDGEQPIILEPVAGEYGKFRLVINTKSSEIAGIRDDAKYEIESEMEIYGSEMNELEMEELLNSMIVVFKIKFPSEIKQIKGEKTDLVTLDKDTITFDLFKISTAIQTHDLGVLEFTNSTTAAPITDTTPKTTRFSDVKEDAWYYDAVEYMASKGIVNGVGDGKFDPNSNITYAQFCQIVARTVGMMTGEQNGYWAYQAIESCIDAGIINDLGEINGTNYNVPMTREASVAGVYRSYIHGSDFTGEMTITSNDIPDYNDISDTFKDDIVAAYNIGVTSGVDESRTFLPQSILTRAQVCQMIYNMVK